MKKYCVLLAAVFVFALASCSDFAAKLCTVTFNANGVGAHPKPVNVEAGAKLSAAQLPALPETDGKIFGGWYKEAACTNKWNTDSDTVSKDITLYAQWTAKEIPALPLSPAFKSFTVTFDVQGTGTAPTALRVREGEKLSAAQLPALSETGGKIFGGWYKEAACANKWNPDSDTVTQNITLYAQWTAKEIPALPLSPAFKSFTVTFDVQGTGTAPAALRVREGEKLTAAQLPALSETDGKIFGGWYKEAACANKWNVASDTVTQNITLYAQWTALYTVRFDARKIYTDTLEPLSVADGNTIPMEKLPSLVHSSWKFRGWHKDKACVQAWTAADKVTADTILYAKWTPKNIAAQELWKSRASHGAENYFRIPALAETRNGALIAVTDLRYNHSADIGRFGAKGEWGESAHIHRVDLVVKRSLDHGVTWDSADLKITDAPDNPVKYGYGDAAVVADRESDNALILCAHGDTRYVHYQAGQQATRLKVVRLRSSDGGQSFGAPEEITDSIYNLNSGWGTLFFGSGKIMQSRKVKNGSYYRLYAAILVKDTGNFVLYSDDFGETWRVLGSSTSSPIGNGDEAKVEELPDGRVLLSSRTAGGRLFNMFTYTNEANGSGSWETKAKAALGVERGTNGEILIVKARNTATGALEDLALQSIPLSSKAHPKGPPEPNIRTDVGIYWRPVTAGMTLSDFANGSKWTKHQRFSGESGYSTMVMQQDCRLGFLFEKYDNVTAATDMNDVYDIRYETLTLNTITGGRYEAAFLKE
ncbi:MAG: InlB B-repeat-containing protein [Treponema sp.]